VERPPQRAKEITLRGWEDFLREIVQRALEEKARLEGRGEDPGLVETQDLLRVIEEYRKIKDVVEKIRYGQYL